MGQVHTFCGWHESSSMVWALVGAVVCNNYFLHHAHHHHHHHPLQSVLIMKAVTNLPPGCHLHSEIHLHLPFRPCKDHIEDKYWGCNQGEFPTRNSRHVSIIHPCFANIVLPSKIACWSSPHCRRAVGNLHAWERHTFYILYQQTTAFSKTPFFLIFRSSFSFFVLGLNFINTSSYSCGNHCFVFLKQKLKEYSILAFLTWYLLIAVITEVN